MLDIAVMSNYKRPKFWRRPRAAVAIGVLAVPLLGGATYAAATTVSDNPKPQIVIPASSSHSTGNTATRGVSDNRGDRGRTLTTTVQRASDDNPATHDAGDDHGPDNPATTPATSAPRTPDDNPATHDAGDDHGDQAQATPASPGSGSSEHQPSTPGSGAAPASRHGGHDDSQPHR